MTDDERFAAFRAALAHLPPKVTNEDIASFLASIFGSYNLTLGDAAEVIHYSLHAAYDVCCPLVLDEETQEKLESTPNPDNFNKGTTH